MVFRNGAKNMVFAREILVDSRPLLEYSFQADGNGSRYRVRTLMKDWFRTGYYGTVVADPATADVVQLTLATDELPPVTGSCQTISTFDYTRQQIGDASFLLPSRTRQRFVGATGSETENTVGFSGCREYSSESTVKFFEDPEQVAGDRDRAFAKTAGVPPGLKFTLELTTPIRTDEAAAGDPFTARLMEPLRDAQQNTIAPAGSVVLGRLLQVHIAYGREPEAILVLRPRSIESNGSTIPLAAIRDWVRGPGQVRDMMLPEFWEVNSGVFQFKGEHVIVARGFRSEWRTVTAR